MLSLIFFSSKINNVSSDKTRLFTERCFLFLRRDVKRENKQYCYYRVLLNPPTTDQPTIDPIITDPTDEILFQRLDQ